MALLPIDSLPLGFRFRPTDEELVNYYLIGKICGRKFRVEVIPEVDVCKCEPWDLPDKSIIRNDDPEWFFFSAPDRKYPNGHRSNRATEAGYWKATGKDRKIKSRSEQVGTKKTLVFYRGRAPAGERTNWIMHEYRANEKGLKDYTGPQDAFVLCRLFKKTEEKTENPSCDLVDPSGFSPATSKSSPEDLPMDTEDPALKNGSPHLAEGPQLPHAVTESDEAVDIDQWLAVLLDNRTLDCTTQNDLKCDNYMEGPDQDAPGPPFDPKFHSSDSNAALMSSNSGSLHDDWHQTGNLSPFQDTSVEQNDSYVDPSKLWEQWLNLSGDEYPEELPNNCIEAVDDTGITIRSRKPQETNSNNFSLQGSAPRRIRLQRNMIRRCYPDSDNEAEAEEAPEAREIILEPVNDVKPESCPDQVVTPANEKHIRTLTHRQPKAKAAMHQDASSSLGAKKEPAESKPSKNSIDKDSSYLQPAAANSKTKPRLAIKFCLVLFIIIIIILITAVWRGNKS